MQLYVCPSWYQYSHNESRALCQKIQKDQRYEPLRTAENGKLPQIILPLIQTIAPKRGAVYTDFREEVQPGTMSLMKREGVYPATGEPLG